MCMFVYFSKAKKKSAVRKDKQILFHAITMLINNFNLFDLPWSHTLNLCYEHKQQTPVSLLSLHPPLILSSLWHRGKQHRARYFLRQPYHAGDGFIKVLLLYFPSVSLWNIMFKRLNSIMCVLVISMHEMMYLMDVSWLIRVWKWIIMQKTTGRGQ